MTLLLNKAFITQVGQRSAQNARQVGRNPDLRRAGVLADTPAEDDQLRHEYRAGWSGAIHARAALGPTVDPRLHLTDAWLRYGVTHAHPTQKCPPVL